MKDNRTTSVNQLFRAQRIGRGYLSIAQKRRHKIMVLTRALNRAKYIAIFLLLLNLVTDVYFLVIHG